MATYKTRPCVDCGRPVTRQTNSKRRWLCLGCAETRVERNARSIAGKNGPEYRKWKAGNIMWAMRLARGDLDATITLPLDTTVPKPQV